MSPYEGKSVTEVATGSRSGKGREGNARQGSRSGARPLRLADQTWAVLGGWVLLTACILAAWQWAGDTGLINPLFFSYPSAIFEALLAALKNGLIVDAEYTLGASLIGFAAAAVAGVVVALLLSQSAYLYKLVNPYFTALNTLPRVALAPLFVMWWGIGLFSHIVMAASLTFFVVFANTIAGIENIDQDHLLLAKLQGATRWQTFRWFVFPSSLPSIFVGLELGFIFGMLGVVSGEMIVGEHGFGVRLQRDAGIFDTKDYFACLLVLMVITTLITFGFQLAKRYLIRWKSAHITSRV